MFEALQTCACGGKCFNSCEQSHLDMFATQKFFLFTGIMSGYSYLVGAMVLQPVDALSDDEAPAPKAKPSPKQKTLPRPKKPAEKKAAAKPKLSPTPKAPPKEKATSSKAEASQLPVQGSDARVMKRPSALRPPKEPGTEPRDCTRMACTVSRSMAKKFSKPLV